jgi:glycosyltransferase involved in cell wall biosynthesis
VRGAAVCQKCGAFERHRALYVFYSKILPESVKKRKRILHFSPENCLANLFRSFPVEYIPSEYQGPGDGDMQGMKYPDNRFDMIISHHVLEHVGDDGKALSEIWRVLEDDGVCYLSVPVCWGSKTEEYGFADPKQNYHYRMYGDDLVDKFGRFSWKRIDFKDLLNTQTMKRFGIDPEEPIFELKKGIAQEKHFTPESFQSDTASNGDLYNVRIALLTTDSVPIVGGISAYLHDMCLELSKRVPITVYSSVHSTPEHDGGLEYPIHRLQETRRLGRRRGDGFPLFRKFNTLHWHLQKPLDARKLVHWVRNECAPSHILIGRWEERSHDWCRACHVEGIPYYLFAYGMELVESKPSKWREKRKQDFIEAKRVVSISGATTMKLIELGVEQHRIIMIPPGVRFESYEKLPLDSLNKVLSKLGLSDGRYILSLGRLVRRKGMDLAIRAFSEIAGAAPDLILVIAGDGPEAAALRALVNSLHLDSRVRFLGEVSESTKRALLQGCGFFLMPNRPVPGDMEGFGIVFLEAAAYGKAVIGGNNGGVPDAVIDGRTGLLVDTSGSHEPLTEAMQELLGTPGLSYQLGKAGEERVLKEFTWAYLASVFLDPIIQQFQPMAE